MGRDLRWTNSNQLTWKQKINKKNSYDIMLGHEISYRSNEYLLGQAMDFPVDYLGNNNLGLGATPSKVVTDFGDKKLFVWDGVSLVTTESLIISHLIYIKIIDMVSVTV